MAEPIFCLITQHVMHVAAVCFIPLTSTGYLRFLSSCCFWVIEFLPLVALNEQFKMAQKQLYPEFLPTVGADTWNIFEI